MGHADPLHLEELLGVSERLAREVELQGPCDHLRGRLEVFESKVPDEPLATVLAPEPLDVSALVVEYAAPHDVLGVAEEATLDVKGRYHARVLYSVPKGCREFYREGVLAFAEST